MSGDCEDINEIYNKFEKLLIKKIKQKYIKLKKSRTLEAF